MAWQEIADLSVGDSDSTSGGGGSTTSSGGSALLSHTDLATYLGIDNFDRNNREGDTPKADAIDYVLAQIQDDVELLIHRPLQVREFVERIKVPRPPWMHSRERPFGTMSGAHGSYSYGGYSYTDSQYSEQIQRLRLKHTPAHKVEAFKLKRHSDSDYTTINEAVYDDYFELFPVAMELVGVYPGDTIDVRYLAGMFANSDYSDIDWVEPVPGSVKMLILRAAARECQAIIDDSGGSRGTDDKNFPQPAVGLTMEERESIIFTLGRRY